MSLLFVTALAAAASTVPVCSWDRPGANPYMGDVVAAVDHYTDLPLATRQALKKRMAARQYDDVAVIKRDSIAGKHRYGSEIADMHFGPGQVCRSVTRSKWTDKAEERGLVYCEGEHCIIVPTVCRNVSRVSRVAPQRADAGPDAPAAGGSDAGQQRIASAATGDHGSTGDFPFGSPAAGPSFEQASDASHPGQPVSPAPRSGSGDSPGGSGGIPGGGPVFGGNPGGSSGGGNSPPWPIDPVGPTEIGAIRPPAIPVVETPTAPIPEPAAVLLSLLGLAGVAAAVRRRRRVSA